MVDNVQQLPPLTDTRFMASAANRRRLVQQGFALRTGGGLSTIPEIDINQQGAFFFTGRTVDRPKRSRSEVLLRAQRELGTSLPVTNKGLIVTRRGQRVRRGGINDPARRRRERRIGAIRTITQI